MAATSRGIDVSSYQGAQDWKTLAAGGLTFAWAKASEGEHTRDAHYRMHMDGICAVPSLLPGAYHYGWPCQPVQAEADNYIGAVKGDADAHPLFVHALDLEKGATNYGSCTASEIRAYAEGWIDRVKAAFPRQRVGVYTSAADIAAGHRPRNADFLWYPAYPAGAMSYTQAEQRSRPAPSGVKADFWQFTSTPMDRSIAYMTPAALRAWAGQEDDMPLTDADAQKLVKTLLDYDDVPASRVLPNSDAKTNPKWTVRYTLQAAVESARSAQQAAEKANVQLTAQAAAITALAAKVGSGDDVATIVAAVQKSIADAVVHVTVSTESPAADA